MNVELTISRSRIEKAAATGAMSTAEQVQFFSDINELLKQHAKAKHPTVSSERAFCKELESDESFRSIVIKSRELQEELNSG